MSSIKLDEIPRELIAHIASYTDASSVLNLSAVNHGLRNACYDTLVFKSVLSRSQEYNWHRLCLDIDAIGTFAGNDAVTWAKYAIADQRAWILAQRECPLEIPLNFISFLPELFVIGHPFMNHQCWSRFMRQPLDQKPAQIFCLAMAILACDKEMPQVRKSLWMQSDFYLRRDQDMKAFLWALCTIALQIRSSTIIPDTIAGETQATEVITPPKAAQIPLRPWNHEYRLPTPFSRRAIDLYGPFTSAFGGWDSWYGLHNSQAFKSHGFLTEGTWCGFTSYFVRPNGPLQNPMTNLKFALEPMTPDAGATGDFPSAYLTAEGRSAEHGVYDIKGTVTQSFGYEITIVARHEYRESWVGRDWHLRITPFGLVGFCGHGLIPHSNHFRRDGIVWLWKREWTES